MIDLASKPAEFKHGGDWEWWFVKAGMAKGFRVQAKRLFPDGSYKSLFKSGPDPYEQLDKLVKSSKADNVEPLYCFYNFSPAVIALTGKNNCSHTYRRPSYWGCSLALPEAVKKAGSDKLKKLGACMYPWHYLVCDADGQKSLFQSTADFMKRAANRPAISPKAVPARVQRLIGLGDDRRRSSERPYLDYEYWLSHEHGDVDLAGIVVFNDRRAGMD